MVDVMLQNRGYAARIKQQRTSHLHLSEVMKKTTLIITSFILSCLIAFCLVYFNNHQNNLILPAPHENSDYRGCLKNRDNLI